MDGATLSRYPHLSWTVLPIPSLLDGRESVLHARRVAHFLCLALDGEHVVRSITQGRDTNQHMPAGAMQFGIADDELHTVIARPLSPCRRFCILMPRHHLSTHLAADGCERTTPRPFLLPRGDRVLRECMMRLVSTAAATDGDATRATDEAARRLVLRVAHLAGCGTPDWHEDESVFDRRTVVHLVERIDAHLKTAPSLSDMAARVGLSPSHFARKFRRSTGLSLHRFVTRRRIRAALSLLETGSLPIPVVAREVGFSSQGQLTHLVGALIGVTPAKFRRQVTGAARSRMPGTSTIAVAD